MNPSVPHRLALAMVLLLAFAASTSANGPQPRLVLFVIVDQLRGDMPWRFQDRLGEGGLRLLMEQGVAYRQAYFA